MVEKDVVMEGGIGSNVGPGKLLVKISGKYKSESFLTFNDKRIISHYIFDIMGAGIKGGLTVSSFLFTIIVLFAANRNIKKFNVVFICFWLI